MQNCENVQVNTVDELPWEIDGLQIYKKQSTMDFWWDEQKMADGGKFQIQVTLV